MVKKVKEYNRLVPVAALLIALLLTGCKNGVLPSGIDIYQQENMPESTENLNDEAEPAVITAITPDGPLVPFLEDITMSETEPVPELLQNGSEHPRIAELQERLMELGFMDNDEPTEYYGDMTESAVIAFQRQNHLNQNGVVETSLWTAVFAPEANFYEVSRGDQGEDIKRIQYRLYELGYLPDAALITGNYEETTEAAVRKLQELNGLEMDGKVGQNMINLIYSEEVKPDFFLYGEKSDVVLACQKRLKELGYMLAEPNGIYGNDTIIAVKQFQARNDLVVDGYLGPSTKIALENSKAQPNGPILEDSGSQMAGGPVGGVSSLIAIAASKIGKPYAYGGKGSDSFDCSGFVYWCLNQAGVRQSYLTSAGWENVNNYTQILDFNSIRAGDIVVANGHVGIAAGDGEVIDASSSHGKVVLRSLSSWWAGNFICAWRIY